MAAWPWEHESTSMSTSMSGSMQAVGAAPPAAPGRIGGDPAEWVAAPATVSPDATRPVRVGIDRLGVDAQVVDLGIEADGALEVPGTGADVGWLTTGAVPGRVGPAVLAGHVDSGDGAGVFARLHEVVPGDRVHVELDAGDVLTFTVVAVEQVAKDAFPTEAVYGPAPTPELRLVTCGGEFDRSADSYRDNVLVTAVPVTDL